MRKKPPPHAAWAPPSYEKAHVYALKALQDGRAEPHQQQMALTWIVNMAARTYDLSYRPDSERDSAFAEGRRFVGLEIVKLLNLDPRAIKEVSDGGPDTRA